MLELGISVLSSPVWLDATFVSYQPAATTLALAMKWICANVSESELPRLRDVG